MELVEISPRSLPTVSALFKRRFYKLLIRCPNIGTRGPWWKNESWFLSLSDATTISSAGASCQSKSIKTAQDATVEPRSEAAAGWEAGLEQSPQALSPSRARQAVVFRVTPSPPQSPGLRVLAPQRPPRGSGVLCPACLAILDLPSPPLAPPTYPNLSQRTTALSAYPEGSQRTLRAPSMLWAFPACLCVPVFPAIAFTGMSCSSCTHGSLRESWLWRWCGPARGRCCLPNRGRIHPQGMPLRRASGWALRWLKDGLSGLLPTFVVFVWICP